MWLGLCRNVLILAVFSRYVTLESALANEEDGACSSDTFRCKEAISPGSYCIPKNWECDSDADCPGGEDEHEDCSIPTCPSNQFQCKLGAARCVPNGWLCDGEHDCDDGSDELHETCKNRKKGKKYRGSFVDTFECLPNHYRCPGTRSCIHFDQVCDGITDCFEDRADEGSHCRNTGCKNLLLDNKKCPLCRETLQGAQCYCPDFYVYDTNHSICVDINECKYNEFCDQLCENHKGGYECSCMDGYSKNGTKGRCLANNRAAKRSSVRSGIINTVENSRSDYNSAKIIFANYNNIKLYSLNGRNLVEPQLVNGSQIETLDFDIKNNSVCWVNFVKSTESNLKCISLSDPSHTWQLFTHHKLTSVSHVARDWVGDNWYFADDVKETIFLCSGNGIHCVNIITIDIKRPKSLALDPTRGLLFFADWSMNAKIERTNMDGGDRKKLVVKKIVHPNGLALDYVNKHVYWGDSFLDYIERVDYDGENRRVIAIGENVDHVFGLTLFENYLYVSNHHNNSIVRVHRYQQNNMTVINKQTLTKPSDIHIIHPVKQPQVSDDVCGKKKCDHICVPVPHSDNQNILANCMCRSGYTLVNGNTCRKNKDSIFLLYANAQQGNIQGISKDDEKSQQVIEPIINLNRPMAIAYDNKTSYIYYSDVSLLHIGRRKAFTTDAEPEKFLDTGVTSSEGLAIDWIGRNLYWTDDGHKTINIVKLTDTTKRYTVIRNLNHPKAIVLDANKGYMYWTDWVLKPSENIKSRIVKAEMNGQNNQTLVETNIQWPNSLTLDYTTQMIYWTDAYYDRIEKISANGDQATRTVIVSFKHLNHPYGIAVFEDFVFFTESLSGQVKRFNMKTNVTVIIRNDSNPLFDLQLYNPQQQVIEGDKTCAVNNGGCTDICVTLPSDGSVCICSDERLLQADKKTCEANPDYKPPAPCNKDREFTCKDESCINILWKCDGERDCLDGSDEDHSKDGTCDVPCATFQCHKSENMPCLKEEQLRCDGEKDCPNGEDEEDCGTKSRDCQANYTSCGTTSNRCIPSAWVCDKEADCVDGSDEDPAKCDTAKCVVDQFQCAYGHCIPYMYRCDNEYDCPDHSDELDCTNWCDPLKEFSCANKLRCIKKNLVCDGEKHCADGSDELHCNVTKKVCHDKEFQCKNGECITQVWKCDGDFDCSDESDEDMDMCGQTRSCYSTEFKCTENKQCIPGAWKCDGDKDCGDGSDEEDSQCAAKCSYPNFKCAASDVCLPPTKYCDGVLDCTDHSDEPRTLCSVPVCQDHECSHFCHPAPALPGRVNRYVCSCPENQHIGSDNKTCQKTDICAQWGICSQLCVADISKAGGYRCLCKDAYTLQLDGFSCKPNVQPVHLIYSNRHEMRRVDLGEKSYVSLVAGLRNTIAMDYHYKKQFIFWTDVIDDKIYRGKMIQNISELIVPPKALTNMKAIVNVGLATTEGLAVDWISDKIYWVESNLDQIEVAEINGSNRRTLIAGNMTSPRAIVLDPRYGALFWSDWDGRFPRIETCSMSGKERKVLFDVRSNFDLGGWPNGMTLDYDVNRIYWVDARSDSLHSMTYEGKDHRLILKSHDYLAQPFSVSVFEHYVYWTDWRTNSVLRANKFNGSDVTEIQKTFTQPFDVQVFHPNRQPDAHNPCEIKNGGCSHLCLIGYPDKTGKTTADCQCPHRMKLNLDQHSCDEDNKFLIFVKRNEIRGVDLQHANYNVIPSITVRFIENSTTTATAIDYDLKEQRLYWTDEARNVINSAGLNGSGVETVIDSGLSNPKGFAIDYLSRNMYFSSYNKDKDSSTISVAKLNGAFRTEIISQNLKQLNSLAIHPGKGLMFWSDVGGSQHKIIKANMDGSNQIVLVNNTFKPASLTVDTLSHALYWINQDKSTIHRCPLDVLLGQCEKLNVSFNDNLLVSMVIFEDEIYVYSSEKKNKSANSIMRIDKSFKKVVMRTNTPDISAIQIYNTERGKDGSNGCSKDNGGCSQLCLPTNTARICKCTAGFKLADDQTTCHGITSFMLYSTEFDIQGFTLDNPSQVALASISKISLASAIDFHAEDDYIYWVDSNARAISRIKRNLTQREEIINEGLNSIEGLAVDWVANHIYWTDRSHNTVEVAKTDGSNRYVLIHEGLDNPTSIVVHPRNGMLYFIDQGKHPAIMQAKLDGSDLKPLINADIVRPRGLAIDYDTDELYWCERDSDKVDKIVSYDFNTQKLTHMFSPGLTDCVSLSIFKDYIYWADTTDGNGSIKRINKSFKEHAQYLRQNLTNKLKHVQIFDKDRQKVSGNNICLKNKYNCAELCLYRGSGLASCICSYGRLKLNGRDCEAYTEFLMFSKVTGIESVSMARTPSKNPPFKPISNETMQNVIGLAYDYKGNRLFFSDIQRGDLQSVFFNGSDLQTVKEGVGSAEGLVFDAKNNNLYFTSYTKSSINRIDFDSEKRDLEILIQLSENDHPRAIVLHSCQSRIFWTNWNNEKPRIQRSFLDGFGVESIITERIETPNGLAVDNRAEKLYWSDARLDKIERCNLDGSDRVVIVTSIPQHAFGLAVYGDYMYWTDWMLRAVLRASKYDGSEITWLVKNIERQPMGIIAVAEDADNCTLSPCFNNTYGCEGECITNEKGLPHCVCPPGKFLLPDGRRCATEKNLNCSMIDYVCEDGRMCISIEKTCNGVRDCLDSSDESEQYCKTRKCPADYYSCNNTRCVYLDKICNGINDCGDNSDEKQCPCGHDEFQCDNGMCISNKYRCDRDDDCPDFSDEKNCNLNCTDVEMDGHKVHDLIPCKQTSACIFEIWKCDGTNDCWDNSDEENCNASRPSDCPPNSFNCTSGVCIPMQWKCDKDFDCADLSDEADCKYTCSENEQFACADSTCLPKTWQCDGHPDCPDGSDEDGCDKRKCKDEEFMCTSTGKCIPKTWVCDGDTDCQNDEDEPSNCTNVLCEDNEFQCLNRKCIPQTFFCDRDDDCGDNSDEAHCLYPACKPDQFKCVERGLCIDQSDRCNGLFDCPDHSDEMNCTVASPCGGDKNKHLCSNGLCIDDSNVCNGRNDCGDYSDEPPNCGIDECEGNHLCNHRCIDKKIGYECGCKPGYVLRADDRTCQDVNECNTTFPCTHYCHNTIGSYHCSCAAGYKLSNHRNCKTSEPAELILSNRYYIRNVSLPWGNTSILKDTLVNAVALDVDYKSNYIYWSDISSRSSSINRMRKNDSKGTIEVLHKTTVRNPDGIAVDWVGNNLYWCDKTTDTIEVSQLNGKYRRILVREGLQEPRGLEVFPAKGVLFYTDWGDNHHIGRVWMDGSKHETIIKDNLGWPNALTIDYVTEKIIWADGSLDYIAMANLDGSGRRIIVSESQRVPHIFDLATFENFIYWTDWEHMGIFYANKFTGANVSQLMSFVHKPMGLQIYHPLKQVMPEEDPCENKGCSHLCLLRPRKGNLEDIESVCSCPENFHLSKDNKQCISNCTSAQFLCKESSKCIPSWWKCDGHDDCDDESDEPSDCATYHCLRTGFFQCKAATSSNDCVPPGLICNGVNDCKDGSDEVDCKSFPCLDHHFKCRADDKCIPEFQKCDGNKTCSDGEDEKDCPMRTCSANQFQCNNGLCVPYVWKCDKDDDCGDSSDEPHNCTLLACKDKHIKCNKSGRCIPEAWQCDGDRDCGEDDKSDEDPELCHTRTCDPTYFACTNSHCIPGRWKCDGYDDCRDNSDEIDCDPRNCSESEWQCNIGKCIHKNLRCNKEINCEDGSDEVDCENITCDDDEFTCKNIKHCIPVGWQCDGDTDCADGTDEWNCNRTCTEHEYKCKNSICLSALWQCDGDNDCGDNSDEQNCENYTCTPGRFRCQQDHICIWNNMVCDGKLDCKHGEDEDPKLCGDQSCKPGDFRCHSIKGNATNQCISADKVCDNHLDCKDGSDELDKFCNTTTCAIRNGGCDQICDETYSRVVCSCNDGYRLRKDGTNCMRFNPCKEFGVCSQLCESNDFKPKCSCDKGFIAVANSSCIAEGEPPNLLIAEEGKVISTPLQLNASKLTVLNTQPQISNHIVAMDVDVSRKDWLAFTVVLSKNHTWIVNSMKIPKGQITTKPNGKRPKRDTSNILFTSFADIRGLTADWIGEHIYWTEGTTHSIKVAQYDGKQANTIVNDNLEDPQDIVVHPKDKQLFWSDLGLRPRIERSNLDGTNRTVIVSEDLSWPNGLAVDYFNDRLYWADTKKYTIESVDLNGDDRRLIHKLNASDPPYKLEVFENFIYVLTYKNFDVLRMHKFGKPDQVLKKMYGSSDKIQEVVILQENKQKKFNDSCVTANSCVETQMCFNDWSEKGHSCKCPDNSQLEDQKCSFQKEKDTCQPGYCQNNGTCSKNVHNKLKCDCPPLFEGERCEIDKCHNLCIIGKCVESKTSKNGVKCICDEGYKGERCEKYKCTDYCKNNGICSIKDDKPYCFCSSQYSGERCEHNTTEKCSHCFNGASCDTEASGYIRCYCQPGFVGVHCDQCTDLHCYNGGVCHNDKNNTAYCSCKHGFDTPNCVKSIYNCDEICQSAVIDKGNCNCPCEGIQCLCQQYECNLGNCTVENDEAKCDCDEVHDGSHCERCRCVNGQCTTVDDVAVCSCNKEFTGTFCEDKNVGESNSGSILSNPLTIVIPIIVSFIIIVLVVAFIICRRRKRWQQYRHKRMQEPRNLDVNNPIYLQNDEEVEDIEPLESSPIYTGNKNTNFANPMYDIRNTESMSMLLQSRGDAEDSNIIEEGGLSVSYYRNGEVNVNNNTTSKA